MSLDGERLIQHLVSVFERQSFFFFETKSLSPDLGNRYGTRLLQKVDVPIIDNEKCEIWHRTRGIDLRIFSEMMCAGYEDGQKDACVVSEEFE